MGMIIMNGKEYASSPKDGFPPIIYSDEEREIGVWRDGRPLYQKTIYCGDFTTSGNKSVAHNITNLDRVVMMYGTFNEGTTRFPLPIVMWGSAVTYQIRLAITDTDIIISRDTAAQSVNLYVTVQYTKTTDVPGSGKYTTYGGLAHHYSTIEQVVGTWIDGKPLYERTVTFSDAISLTRGNWNDIYTADWVSTIDKLVYGNLSRGLALSNYPGDYGVDAPNKHLRVAALQDDTIYAGGTLTVQYTKTTD